MKLFLAFVLIPFLAVSASPLFGFGGASSSSGSGGLGGLFGGGGQQQGQADGQSTSTESTATTGSTTSAATESGSSGGGLAGLLGGGNSAGTTGGSSSGLSPQEAQEAIMGYSSDVQTVNTFLDTGMQSDNPGQLAQNAADAESNEMTRAETLCPNNAFEAPSAAMGEACTYLKQNTGSIVRMLQSVANTNQVAGSNGFTRVGMASTMAQINEVRCPQVLPRIQIVLDESAKQNNVNSSTVQRPNACSGGL